MRTGGAEYSVPERNGAPMPLRGTSHSGSAPRRWGEPAAGRYGALGARSAARVAPGELPASRRCGHTEKSAR